MNVLDPPDDSFDWDRFIDTFDDDPIVPDDTAVSSERRASAPPCLLDAASPRGGAT